MTKTNTTGDQDAGAPTPAVEDAVDDKGVVDPLSLDDDLEAIEDAPVLGDKTQPIDDVSANLDLLLSTRRRLTPIRGGAVQLPRTTEGSRMGPLMRLVTEKQHVAFDLELAMLTLQPITRDGDFLGNGVLARFISVPEHGRVRSAPAISRALKTLEDADLLRRPPPSRRPVLWREDGVGDVWTHPGDDRDKIGFFSLPRVYWTKGYHGRLSLAGKAMLLIILSATNEPTTLTVTHTYDQFAEYYGLSPSTVKRGMQDLRKHDLLREKTAYLPAPRSTTKWRAVTNYWLAGAFSTTGRERARTTDAAERKARGVPTIKATIPLEVTTVSSAELAPPATESTAASKEGEAVV